MLRAAAAGRALAVAPVQVLQPAPAGAFIRFSQSGSIGLRRPARLDAPREPGERQVAAVLGRERRARWPSVSATSSSATSFIWMWRSRRADQLVELGDVARHARLHQRLDRRGEQVHDGLLRAAEAGAVAARRRPGRPACRAGGSRARRCPARGRRSRMYFGGVVGRSSQKSQLRAQLLDRVAGVCAQRPQRVVVADRDALHAALAGVGVDRDADSRPPLPGLALFRARVK